MPELKAVEKPPQQDHSVVDILVGANVALRLISARLITVLALVMTCGMFVWTMCDPSVLRCIMAATWAVVIFLPVLWTGRRGHDHG